MLLNDVLDRALQRAGLTETNSEHRDQARVYVNATMQDIASRATWWWMHKEQTITTVASQRTYNLATDVQHLISVRDTTNDRLLHIVHSSEIDSDDPDQSRTGDAKLVYVSGTDSAPASDGTSPSGAPTIELHPTPDTSSEVITYRYYRTFPELTSSNDTDDLLQNHGIPVLLHHALYMGAAAGIMVEYGDDASAQLNDRGMEHYIRQAKEINGRNSGNREYRLRRHDARMGFSFQIEEGSLK